MREALAAFGPWLLRFGVLAVFLTALLQALLPELGFLAYKLSAGGSYQSGEFRWELAWLPYGVGVACLLAGTALIQVYGKDRA